MFTFLLNMKEISYHRDYYHYYKEVLLFLWQKQFWQILKGHAAYAD
jgi:hypothetical protein